MNKPELMVHIFGVRHHGPGSACGVLNALNRQRPDCVLVEGPPDAQTALPLMLLEEMRPPVALLVYAPNAPRKAAFFPFAEFSPEWQALNFALAHGIEARFFDLPQAYQLALRLEPDSLDPTVLSAMGESREHGQAEGDTSAPDMNVDPDAFQLLAHAAGYGHYEQWWEHVIEQRPTTPEVFEALCEAMAALRERDARPRRGPDDDPRLEPAREAYMRQMIRAAEQDGFEQIAVVCGAWHAPALVDRSNSQTDATLLKDLPKLKVQATWTPWTHGRLTFSSGYGAGVASPGWYQHLWAHAHDEPREVVVRWLARVAAVLREEGLDVGPGHIIEAARLAEALAALRGRTMPDLSELNEAALAVICGGNPLPLQLVQRKLIVGEALGSVPEVAPAVPLLRDVQQEQKRLRLSAVAEPRWLDLDLRKPSDLGRSHLLHRLNLLGVPWAKARHGGGKGTFREAWELSWQPEFTVAVIEAGVWGNTTLDAATTCATARADGFSRDSFAAHDRVALLPALAELTQLLNSALLADLPDAIIHIMNRLRDRAAASGDAAQLMDALPPLADALRYGNVRQTDAGMVAEVVDGFVARICIGLPGACSSLNDDAAREMLQRVTMTNGVVSLLQNEEHGALWHAALRQLADQRQLHGLVAGRCVRLLHDAKAWDSGAGESETERRFGMALSTATDPSQAAAWVEGFVGESGQLLVHDDALWRVIDAWVSRIPAEAFTQVLPLLRRTFGVFRAPERRNLGERARRGCSVSAGLQDEDIDMARAEAALPLVMLLLGISPPENSV